MSHQSKTSVNSYEMFQRVVQSRLEPEEIREPDNLPLPPFYNDTPEIRKAYARMYDCITLVDKQIGEILAKLEEDGLAEDTIVFLFSDHGQGIPRFKSTPFGLGLRVPLIIRVPEKFRHLAPLEPGTSDDRIVSFVDFGPTVLDLCGGQLPAHMSGVPFLGPKQGPPNEYFHGSLCNSGESEELSRTVSDGRHVYVRNYMPHLSYAQPFLYFDSAEIARLMKEYRDEGTLTRSAAEYMAPTRPPEALYDLENDPWEIHNLAGDPEKAPILQNLREANRKHLLQIRDLHFMHPWERKRRAGVGPECELRLDPKAYPFESILRAAELVGKGETTLQQQLKGLTDSEPMVRYWSVIGLQSQEWTSERILRPLRDLLEDAAPYIRQEVAAMCYKHNKDARAKEILIEGLKSESSRLVLQAVRKIQLLKEDAADFIDDLRALSNRIPTMKDDEKAYSIQSCITGIENHFAGRYAQPNDDF
jgi:hypothetical protein